MPFCAICGLVNPAQRCTIPQRCRGRYIKIEFRNLRLFKRQTEWLEPEELALFFKRLVGHRERRWYRDRRAVRIIRQIIKERKSNGECDAETQITAAQAGTSAEASAEIRGKIYLTHQTYFVNVGLWRVNQLP
jgi:hypothetical protein